MSSKRAFASCSLSNILGWSVATSTLESFTCIRTNTVQIAESSLSVCTLKFKIKMSLELYITLQYPTLEKSQSHFTTTPDFRPSCDLNTDS